tara:strand:+ start:277 stop:408 length:132 start_codon:yes stop_codon:yes gene_type:complete
MRFIKEEEGFDKKKSKFNFIKDDLAVLVLESKEDIEKMKAYFA